MLSEEEKPEDNANAGRQTAIRADRHAREKSKCIIIKPSKGKTI